MEFTAKISGERVVLVKETVFDIYPEKKRNTYYNYTMCKKLDLMKFMIVCDSDMMRPNCGMMWRDIRAKTTMQ